MGKKFNFQLELGSRGEYVSHPTRCEVVRVKHFAPFGSHGPDRPVSVIKWGGFGSGKPENFSYIRCHSPVRSGLTRKPVPPGFEVGSTFPLARPALYSLLVGSETSKYHGGALPPYKIDIIINYTQFGNV